MSSTDSKISKIQASFQSLSNVSTSLNAASDELTKVVGRLDEALKKLNVGLTDWVIFQDRGSERDPNRYDCDQIGYCKVNSKWGISLRQIWGHEAFDDHNEDGPWLFNDAPREMRLRSVDKIPELIESLSKKAAETTKKIQEKTKEVSELAAALTEPTRGPVPTATVDAALGFGLSPAQLRSTLNEIKRQDAALGKVFDYPSRWELINNHLRIEFADGFQSLAKLDPAALERIKKIAAPIIGDLNLSVKCAAPAKDLK